MTPKTRLRMPCKPGERLGNIELDDRCGSEKLKITHSN